MRRELVVLVLCAACSRIESSGPPTAEQLATACTKYAACGPPSVIDCITGSRYVASFVSVFRPAQIRCLVEASSNCAEIMACLDDECIGNLCAAGACNEHGVDTTMSARSISNRLASATRCTSAHSANRSKSTVRSWASSAAPTARASRTSAADRS
jgi:hypothetical protein